MKDISLNSSFKILLGSRPALITSPHSVPHRRLTLEDTLRPAEQHTDKIVKELSKCADIYGLIMNHDVDYDPNLHPEERNPFKAEIRSLAQSSRPKCLVDLHGLDEKKSYDFALYFPRRFYRSSQLAHLLAQSIKHSELRDASIHILHTPDSDDRESICKFSAEKLNVPAVQIEVARYIRDDEQLRSSFIQNLMQFFKSDYLGAV